MNRYNLSAGSPFCLLCYPTSLESSIIRFHPSPSLSNPILPEMKIDNQDPIGWPWLRILMQRGPLSLEARARHRVCPLPASPSTSLDANDTVIEDGKRVRWYRTSITTCAKYCCLQQRMGYSCLYCILRKLSYTQLESHFVSQSCLYCICRVCSKFIMCTIIVFEMFYWIHLFFATVLHKKYGWLWYIHHFSKIYFMVIL